MAVQTSVINVEEVVRELQKVADALNTAEVNINKMADAVKAAGEHQQMSNLITAGERFEKLVSDCKGIEEKMSEVIDVTKRYVKDVQDMEEEKLI